MFHEVPRSRDWGIFYWAVIGYFRGETPGSIRGHCLPVCFATTYMQRVRLRRTALRANPRMNTSTQPPEGAGGSRSKAKAKVSRTCRSELAREKLSGNAIIQIWRVIVDVHREQASLLQGKRAHLRSGRPVARLGLAALGQGWLIAAGSVGASMLAKNLRAPRGVRLSASSLTSIASMLAPTGLFPVTRRKGETIGGRYRRNGYTHDQKSPESAQTKTAPI